ncbi:MAG: AAA family ATPase [Candidatus Amulumruptor caecigallinarius]|nr:AAA family ATPase [Candidatus Amulumruptor caecigallinarius]MCM1397779.1 AAA family ATPase [Candidatus Amulumruptor caecigallinarius]MCM1454818.1 AAA family ATPase [bacterium]
MEKSAPTSIKSVSIKNFKSIKSITLSDCRRINVLIGRPNVGKSNLLEALALFDVPYLVNTSNKSLKNLVRIENTAELFHNGISSSPIEVSADDCSVTVNRSANNGLTVDISLQGDISKYAFTPSLNLSTKKEPAILPDILAYFYPKHFVAESSNVGFLLPPSGGNLMATVANLPDLKSNLAELFHGYGLKMMFDSGSQQIKAMRENGLDMFLVPFNSLADSLQRLIFYKSAIDSNRNKVICFEEPEAHTFPPYISNVVNDILASEDNQFFISTHSPYVMSALLESAGDDLAVFVVDMKNNATVISRLSEQQLQEAYENGMDMFYNIEAYLGR